MTKMGSEGDIVNGNEKGKAEEPMFDYQKPDRGWCGDPERGAAMGRTSDLSHGYGFWDGDWPKAEGKALTKAADAMGEVHLYVGDDGKIYGE